MQVTRLRQNPCLYDCSAVPAGLSPLSSFSSTSPSCAGAESAEAVAAAAADAALAAADFFFFFLFLLLADADVDAVEPLPRTGLAGKVHPGAAVRTSTPVGVIRSVSSNWAEYLPSGVAAVHCCRKAQ